MITWHARRSGQRPGLIAGIVVGLALALTPAQVSQAAIPGGSAPVDTASTATLIPAATAGPALVTVSRTGSTTSPFPLTYDRRTPRLTGVSSAIRTTFARAVRDRIAKDLATLGTWRRGCYTGGEYDGPASQYVRWYGGIHNRRYASVVLDIVSNPGCGGVNQSTPYSFTLDLKSGRMVSLGRFALPNGGQLRAAVVWNLRVQNPGCAYEDLSSTTASIFSLPALRNWTVTSRGITFWFAKYAVATGACGTMRGRVPWSDILRPSQVGSRSVTSRMVGEYSYGILTVTGQKAVLYLNGEGGPFCLRGAARSGRLLSYFMDGSDYRRTWDTRGTGSSRRLVGYRAPTSAERARMPQGTAEQLC
jgi:hypothetical protein